jgi:hypothetical protein
MSPSPAVEQSVQKWVSRLEHAFPDLQRCAVVIELPHRRHRHGGTYQVRILVTIPGQTFASTRDPGSDHAHEDIYVAIADAFRAVRRALQDHAQIRRGDVKFHA